MLYEKERYFSQPKSQIYAQIAGLDGKKRNDSYRRVTTGSGSIYKGRQTLAEINMFNDTTDIQILEETMRIGDNKSFKFIDNYLSGEQASQKLRNSTMLNEIALSNKEIAKERVTFDVKIPKWIKTTGNFVEYLIHLQYLEGDR